MSFSRLLSLPPEVIHNILASGDPDSLASWRACCRTLHGVIENDSLLWKEQFLKRFDEPYGNIAEVDGLFFKKELRKFVKLNKLLCARETSTKLKYMSTIVENVVQLLKTAKSDDHESLNIQFLTSCFGFKGNFPQLLCNSSLYDSMRCDALERAANRPSYPTSSYWLREHVRPTSEDSYPLTEIYDCKPGQQLSAKLNCLWGAFNADDLTYDRHWFGLAPNDHRVAGMPFDPAAFISHAVHEYARANVYDLRRYVDANCWGPFQSGGSQKVDWERVEAIMILLSHNMAAFAKKHVAHSDILNKTWNHVFAGLSPQPPSRLTLSPEALDPYDITGTWMRIVCFLDFRDLWEFNFTRAPTPLPNRHRPPIRTEEAIRFIIMNIHVIRLSPPGDKDGKALPVAHFQGTAKLVRPLGDGNDDSRLRGMVRLTPEGEVRWTSWSIFNGEERWRSEGVQVGGIGSRRGVIGTWFDKDFNEEGPAGPTAFWKSNYSDEQ
ncbi:MAG: hypothetical protein LQ342_003143 [Letrouitia transgressa]|nr:MAG: hypothetical protein LQ342_003143 [Letrouitia transgressa]